MACKQMCGHLAGTAIDEHSLELVHLKVDIHTTLNLCDALKHNVRTRRKCH